MLIEIDTRSEDKGRCTELRSAEELRWGSYCTGTVSCRHFWLTNTHEKAITVDLTSDAPHEVAFQAGVHREDTEDLLKEELHEILMKVRSSLNEDEAQKSQFRYTADDVSDDEMIEIVEGVASFEAAPSVTRRNDGLGVLGRVRAPRSINMGIKAGGGLHSSSSAAPAARSVPPPPHPHGHISCVSPDPTEWRTPHLSEKTSPVRPPLDSYLGDT